MNKYVVLTGCAGGIGKETSLVFLSKGYFVIGIDLFDPKIRDKNFHFIKCDLSNFSEIENCQKEITEITPKIDGIVNLAGIFLLQSIVEGNEEDLKKIININFYGTYKINKTLIPLLNKKSKIIVFSSEVANYSPQPFNGYYSLSKIILDKYSDILRRELNYLDLKVIKVQSGAIKTKLLEGVNDKYKATVNNSTYYKKPLTKLKKLMDNEINKQVKPTLVAKKLVKIFEKKHPKIRYRIKNSFKLRFLNSLPEKLQDIIYLNVIK